MKRAFVLAGCVTLAFFAGLGRAAVAGVNVGDKAPSFEAKDDGGHTWKSDDHVGKHILVVYFFPADFTGGCTKQACGFRDDMAKLKEKGIEVVGISGDSVDNHQLFKKYHNLNFTLLADEDGAIAKKFGVPTRQGGKVFSPEIDGKKHDIVRGVSAARWTFVIDKDGKVVLKNEKVQAADDSKAVLAAVEKLK